MAGVAVAWCMSIVIIADMVSTINAYALRPATRCYSHVVRHMKSGGRLHSNFLAGARSCHRRSAVRHGYNPPLAANYLSRLLRALFLLFNAGDRRVARLFSSSMSSGSAH
jgi:hypothetical protein